MRNFIREKVQTAKKDLGDKKSLLNIICSGDVFAHDDEQIIDILMDFFFAATQTNSSTACSMTHFLTQDPARVQRLRQEAQEKLVSGGQSLNEAMTMENVMEVEWIDQVFKEALRFDPPISLNSWIMVNQETKCGGILFRAFD